MQSSWSRILGAVLDHLELWSAPPSFARAEVYCIPKISRPSSGLDCRPLALLNGDYKILSRILATRLGCHFDAMIHDTQNGFVPGRDIHDTIDILTAARALVETGQAPRTLAILTLDFRKACDYVDRAFLRAALLHHRPPARFVEVVMGLHDDTRAVFLANRYESREVAMRNRIRQGCLWHPCCSFSFWTRSSGVSTTILRGWGPSSHVKSGSGESP